MLEKFAQMALLYDFYGSLLTVKQREMLALYYEDNLSLGEIATEYGISRQAVYDLLKRTEKILEDYENKLGLVSKFENNKQSMRDIIKLCKEAQASGDLSRLNMVIAKVSEILK